MQYLRQMIFQSDPESGDQDAGDPNKSIPLGPDMSQESGISVYISYDRLGWDFDTINPRNREEVRGILREYP